MAVYQKIRQRSVLLIEYIALLAFIIVQDLFSNGFRSQSKDVDQLMERYSV
jgi:hypothetical protein